MNSTCFSTDLLHNEEVDDEIDFDVTENNTKITEPFLSMLPLEMQKYNKLQIFYENQIKSSAKTLFITNRPEIWQKYNTEENVHVKEFLQEEDCVKYERILLGSDIMTDPNMTELILSNKRRLEILFSPFNNEKWNSIIEQLTNKHIYIGVKYNYELFPWHGGFKLSVSRNESGLKYTKEAFKNEQEQCAQECRLFSRYRKTFDELSTDQRNTTIQIFDETYSGFI